MSRAAHHFCCGLLLILALAACGGAAERALPPGLTLSDSPAESRLLAQWRVKKADGQWLFEAALAASHDADDAPIERYRRNWHDWRTHLRQTTAGHGPRRQAQMIFEYLHGNVLRGGYQDDCTDLAHTLAGGGYNCVGATVLFNSLADALGLSVHAVETPEHVYSVVTTPAGPVEVEMTCRRWFEVIDDRDKRRAAVEQALGQPALNHTSARTLSPAALVALIYYNAGVDAIADERFAEAACYNLKALRFDPANRLARGNLLATFNNWALALAREQDYAGAVDLLDYGLRMDAEHAPFRSNLVALYQRWFDDLTARGRSAEAQAVLSRFRRELPGE